ncbi:MAG: gamma-glutamyltransferase [Bacteriovoracaceae bacterium]|nr:gamma-glutamyltransferase [Bacteriovoracaceae bacterium]
MYKKIFILLLVCSCQNKFERKHFFQQPVDRARSEATHGTKWVISTQGQAATQAAHQVLLDGGNIIDAAVAASFTISVERPHSTGLGGGGFLIYREAKTKKITVFDFRERAPRRAHARMYLNNKDEVIEDLSVTGHLSVAVPGLVKGLEHIHQRLGKKPWKDLFSHAIKLADEGLVVYPALAEASNDKKAELAKFTESKKIFLKENGEAYQLGEKLFQKDLARTLARIAQNKSAEFYQGETAKAIIQTLNEQKVWMDAQDLKNYQVKERQPLLSTYKGYEIISMPPPSSGGTHVIEMLNMLEQTPLSKWGPNSPESIHAVATAMQLAFLDRARYMGDPDFTKIPLQKLTSKAYAQDLFKKYFKRQTWKADELSKDIPVLPESTDTTHLSIMDAEGNVVVSTQTINGWFGSSVVAQGTGIVLNNEMDDFSAKPGSANIFGAIGSVANQIVPGKTPLSSMTPTIVLKDGQPILAVGAPGGTQIITCVLQTIINTLDFNLPLYKAITLGRIHHQWKPDELRLEGELFSETLKKELVAKGYKLQEKISACDVMAVARLKNGEFVGVSEPRDHGQALVK